MNTATIDTGNTTTTPTTEIITTVGGYTVRVNGQALLNHLGVARVFSTRGSARKAITRALRPAGDRHR